MATNWVLIMIFYSCQAGIFAYGWYKQVTDVRLAGLNRIGLSVAVSRGAGLILTFDMALILLPVCRNVIRTLWIRWLPFEKSHALHRHIAYALGFWAAIHTAAHYVNFLKIEELRLRPLNALQIHYTQIAGITGHIMLLCAVLMYTSAHSRVRQHKFELFWYTHHLSFIFFLALFLHATGCFVRDSTTPFSPFDPSQFWKHCLGYEGWRWSLWGFGIYVLERLYREVRARKDTTVHNVIHHVGGVIELQFSKPSLRYKPGQWLFLNVPHIAPLQWHPFTITSSPFDALHSIHIRVVGDFTRKLADTIDEVGHKFRINVDGPFGAPASDVFSYDKVVMIGGGIGVTPWISILRTMLHAGRDGPRRVQSAYLIWSCGQIETLAAFVPFLKSLENEFCDDVEDRPFLKVEIYVTQKLSEDEKQSIILNSAGAFRDPHTDLRNMLNFYRPHYEKIITDMKSSMLQDQVRKADVGVFFCGPTPAARVIQAACKKASGNGISFAFRKEQF